MTYEELIGVASAENAEVESLRADNARLRALIKDTETGSACSDGDFCPWCWAPCGEYPAKEPHGSHPKRPRCPAFTPEGEVR